jgi:hypothetical protein
MRASNARSSSEIRPNPMTPPDADAIALQQFSRSRRLASCSSGGATWSMARIARRVRSNNSEEGCEVLEILQDVLIGTPVRSASRCRSACSSARLRSFSISSCSCRWKYSSSSRRRPPIASSFAIAGALPPAHPRFLVPTT